MFLYTCSAVLPSLAGDTCAEASPAAASSSPPAKTLPSERCICHLSCRGNGSGVIPDAPADHRHHRLDVFDLIGRNREVIPIHHHQVGQLARLDRPEVIRLKNKEPSLAWVGD